MQNPIYIVYAFKRGKASLWEFYSIQYPLIDENDKKIEDFPSCEDVQDFVREAIRTQTDELFAFLVIEYDSLEVPMSSEELISKFLNGSDWAFDAEKNYWLAPHELSLFPKVAPPPAVMTLKTKEPKHGWWIWNLTFETASHVDSSPAEIKIWCSDREDPRGNLSNFISALEDREEGIWFIDEENAETIFFAWPINDNTLYLRIVQREHFHRLIEGEDREADEYVREFFEFTVDLENFIENFSLEYGKSIVFPPEHWDV